MPRKATELGAVQVKNLSKQVGRHAVGGVAGLHLWVKPTMTASWLLRVLVGGQRRDIGLGGFPDVTLAGAKEAAREARQLIRSGVDPVEQRKQARALLMAEHAKAKTFAECVDLFIEAKGGEWRNAKHLQQWTNTLETYAGPVIGDLLVRDIQMVHVLDVLRPIWKTKTETASRLRGRIEAVLDYATVSQYREGENPARWKGHLEQLLPRPSKVAAREHHPAMPLDQLPEFLPRLRVKPGVGSKALEFLILTAARSGEVRGALWQEIDLDASLWTVPASRMKAGREHRVPLSKQAKELIAQLPRIEGTEFVFPGRNLQAMSDMTLSKILRDMNVACVPHGFRSTFRDWAAERTNYPRELAEMALAHTIDNKVEAAYRRGDMLAKRLQMMQAWANFCLGY